MSKEEGGIPVPDKTSAPEGRPDKLRIFLVSQHTLTRDGWCRLLERESQGRVEAIAVSREEVLQTVANFRPDLVLIDLVLPSREGIEAARTVKAHAPTTTMVVALLMGDEKLYKRMLQEAGIDFLVLKEGQRHALLPMLDAMWENRADQENQ